MTKRRFNRDCRHMAAVDPAKLRRAQQQPPPPSCSWRLVRPSPGSGISVNRQTKANVHELKGVAIRDD